jgi:peptidyl-prolyl cis-trans isomerase SurA
MHLRAFFRQARWQRGAWPVVLALLLVAVVPFCAVQAQQPVTPAASAPARAPAPSAPRLLDRIVAVVNKEVITLSQLNDRIEVVSRQLAQQRMALPPHETLERQVLERMITDRAQMQMADDNGIRIDDLQVDRAVERIAEQNQLSLADFRAAVERDGLSWDQLRSDVRIEITLARLREREVDSRIQVTDTEIDAFLAQEQARMAAADSTRTEFRVSHILVRLPEGTAPERVEQLRLKAEEALRQVRAGTAFSEVAVASSDASDALQGGALGWRTRERLPEIFVNALDRMKPGDTSELLRSPAGFHILHLDEVRGQAVQRVEVEQVHARHILIRTNEIVSEGEARRRIQQLRERIVEGADFAEIAKLNSEDGSASRGGDLGWMYPGDTVPEFERAMFALAVDQMSEPVRSPFGWHLIKVLERRRGDLSSDRRRNEARRAVRERKADEAYDNWVRELRDRTYLEYRLEDR